MGPRHPWGAAICKTVATVEACWGAQHSEGDARIQMKPRHPWGAAIYETVAMFEACWGCLLYTSDAADDTPC
eukprot:4800350-Pyramimonas_sp.AAC.1